VVENNFVIITQDWVINLNNGIKTLAFHMVVATNQLCKDVFKTSIMQVKS